MDDVLRRQGELDRCVDGHVQLVNFAAPLWMLDFPHPLFADNVDVFSSLRRSLAVHVHFGTPNKHDERDQEWHECPKKFKTDRRFGLFGNGMLTATILDGECQDQTKDQDRKERSNDEEKE